MPLSATKLKYLPVMEKESATHDLLAIQLPRSEKSSIRSGILSHGEHAVDLILVQAALAGTTFVDGFLGVARHLCLGIRQGVIELNEKIDGSPSIVFGFDRDNCPFVSYKGGIAPDRKKPQQIFRSEEDVGIVFKEEDPRRALYLALVRNVLPKMSELASTNISNFLFQADLLFVEGDDKRRISSETISIRSNTIDYVVSKDHLLFQELKRAKVGFVVHTLSQRVLSESDSKIGTAALEDSTAIRSFIEKIADPSILAIDPYQSVKLSSPDNSESVIASVEASLARIVDLFQNSISDEFREIWGRQHLRHFRVFNNSHLLPGKDGGIFSIVESNRKFFPGRVIRQYKEYVSQKYKAYEKGDPRRSEQYRLLRAIGVLQREYASAFEALILAYYEAIKVQSQIDTVLKQSIRSKLGGGPVEGHMISSDALIVKWVDRLDFTRKNNERWRGDGSSWSSLEVLPHPFERWKPDSIIVPMKLQPPHLGHIRMIKKLAADFPNREVIVLASDKEVKLDAANWKELGASPTKRDLLSFDFRHTFSKKLRLKLLQEGLGDSVTISIVSTSILRDYLRRAKEAGETSPVVIALGEKEKSAGRYDGDFKLYKGLIVPEYVSMQAEGVNGTSVRRAVRDAAILNCPAAFATLQSAFSYINDIAQRDILIESMLQEFRVLHARVLELVKF